MGVFAYPREKVQSRITPPKRRTVPIRISANSRIISSRLTGREPVRVEEADRLCNACKTTEEKARPLDVAGIPAKDVRAVRTDALTAAVPGESAAHQVVEVIRESTENPGLNLFAGICKNPQNSQRVKEWRKRNPGYWRKKSPPPQEPLQDLCISARLKWLRMRKLKE